MGFKLASNVDRWQITEEFMADFKHPNLYEPRIIIDGSEENPLTIITDENPEIIDYAIWGMLPETWSDDWELFQKVQSTLYLSEQEVETDLWYAEAYRQRRCLVIVSGYYTHFLADGKLYPFYMCRKSGRPLCLAGTYNQLEDGFLTCSIITAPADKQFSQIHNISNQKPLSLSGKQRKLWLDAETSIAQILSEPSLPTDEQLIVYPVSSKNLDGTAMPSTSSSQQDLDGNESSRLQKILSSHNITLGK